MNASASILQAIERFDAWDTPWEFHASVASTPGLTDADREWLEQAWSVACDRDIWLSAASLAAGVAAAEAALEQRFPSIPVLAVQQLARAASYPWR